MNNRKKIIRIKTACLTVVFFLPVVGFTGNLHPRVYITDGEKAQLQQKIAENSWAQDIYNSTLNKVEAYADRHSTDPNWIISRIPRNTTPGARYTTSLWADRDVWISESGDAPVPTIYRERVFRIQRAPDGMFYEVPALDDIPPNNQGILDLYSEAENSPLYTTNGYGQRLLNKVCEQFTKLAYEAAFLYWYTGEEKYAVLARDLLHEWTLSSYYMENVSATSTYFHYMAGLYSIEIIQDRRIYEDIAVAYDFIYDYLIETDFDLTYVTNFIYRGATDPYIRGSIENNHTIFDARAGVICALAYDDRVYGEEMINNYLYVTYTLPQVNEGHRAWEDCLNTFIVDGVWFETPSYGESSVRDMIKVGMILYKNGIDVWHMPNYYPMAFGYGPFVFPNFKLVSFGDTGRRSYPSGGNLEMVYANALNRGDAGYAETALNSLSKYVEKTGEERGLDDLDFIFWGVPELPAVPASEDVYPRTEKMTHARLYLQRNGMDETYGLMTTVYGSYHLHGQVNPMAMEMYGRGYVLGIDPGTVGYDDPAYYGYYLQAAAHNVVIADESTRSIASYRDYTVNPTRLLAMEPEPREEALSEHCSFTYTSYNEETTSTLQERLLSIVRTSPQRGYYLDIYRSDNSVKNDYLYHNVGESLFLNKPYGGNIPMVDTPNDLIASNYYDYGVSSKPMIYPGYHAFSSRKGTGSYTHDVTGIFKHQIPDSTDSVMMKVWMKGNTNRQYYTVMSPPATTADDVDPTALVPVFVASAEGEAWSRPFVAVYEPYNESEGSSIEAVDFISDMLPTEDLVALRIMSHDASIVPACRTEYIFHSAQTEQVYSNDRFDFKGTYGIYCENSEGFQYLYMGKGHRLYAGNIGLESSGNVASILKYENGGYIYSSASPVKIRIPYTNTTEEPFSNLALFYTINNKKLRAEDIQAVADYPGSNTGWLEGTFPPLMNAPIHVFKSIETDIALASDDFQSNTWSGGIGWSDDWAVTAGSGAPVIDLLNGNYCIKLTRGDLNHSITRTLASAIPDATLTFKWDVDSLDNPTEYAYVEVFNGTWHTAWSVNSSGNGTDLKPTPDNLQEASVDLSAYGAVTQIRFSMSDTTASGDYFYLDDVELRITADAAYMAWALDHALSGGDIALLADPDDDGLDNLYEFAVGAVPTNATEAFGILPVIGTQDPSVFQYIHRRRTDTDFDYIVERNTNLVSGIWTTTGVSISGTAPAETGFETVTNYISTGTEPEQFIRLTISVE